MFTDGCLQDSDPIQSLVPTVQAHWKPHKLYANKGMQDDKCMVAHDYVQLSVPVLKLSVALTCPS